MRFLLVAVLAVLPISVQATPKILYSGVDVAELREPQEVVNITVVARASVDPLAGATLVDPVTGATYGGFSADAQKGTYTLSLSLERLTNARPVDPTESGMETRSLRAVVYDVTGATDTVDFSLNLHGKEKYTALPEVFAKSLKEETKAFMSARSYIGQSEWVIRPPVGDANFALYLSQYDETQIRFGDRRRTGLKNTKLALDLSNLFDAAHLEYFTPREEGVTGVIFHFGIRCIERRQALRCWTSEFFAR